MIFGSVLISGIIIYFRNDLAKLQGYGILGIFLISILGNATVGPTWASSTTSGLSVPNFGGLPNRTMRSSAVGFTTLPSTLALNNGSIVIADGHPLLLGI